MEGSERVEEVGCRMRMGGCGGAWGLGRAEGWGGCKRKDGRKEGRRKWRQPRLEKEQGGGGRAGLGGSWALW